jgi:hypothetical protein
MFQRINKQHWIVDVVAIVRANILELQTQCIGKSHLESQNGQKRKNL